MFDTTPKLSNIAPVSLPHLEELELNITTSPNARDIVTGWLPSLVLPKLTALILTGDFAEVTPALQKFGNQLHTLGLRGFPIDSSSPPALPTLNLRCVIVQHDFFGQNGTTSHRL